MPPFLLAGILPVLPALGTPFAAASGVVRAAEAGPRLAGAAEVGAEAVRRLPLAFVENEGQWRVASRFVARRGDLRAHLDEGGFTLQVLWEEDGAVRAQNVRFAFEGGGARPEGVEELPGRRHFLLGPDPAAWRPDVRAFSRVLHPGLYEGVDLLWREGDGHLEYDLRLAPGADLGAVVIRVEGASGPLRIDSDGSLVAALERGALRQPPPKTSEGIGEETRPLEARFRLIGEDRFGFEAPGRDPGRPLLVDPGLIFSTYLGGSGDDTPWAVALTGGGEVVLAGRTYSIDFPVTPGVVGPFFSGFDINADAFVSRLSATGSTLLSSTYLGGTNGDAAEELALDPSGAAWIVGRTRSTDFPTSPGAADPTFNGGTMDGFVARVSAGGEALLYSTYLGGGGTDQVCSVVLDAAGGVTIVGNTASDDFPVTPGAYDTSQNGGADVFVARLATPSASVLFSTFLGGSLDDGPTPLLHGPSLAVDLLKGIFVGGTTRSPDFPTTAGAFDTMLGGTADAFLARLTLSGSQLVASTLLGGSVSEEVFGMAVLPTGAATLAGSTDSTDFPATPGALDQTYNGGNGASIGDGFVARLNLAASSLQFATYLGGALDDRVVSFALDPTGATTVGGRTDSSDFPVTPGAYDVDFAGPADAFLTRLGPTGGNLQYSTFLGSAPGNETWAIALDPKAGTAVAGWTLSDAFPTTAGAYDTTFNGIFDVWVARLDMLPTGVARFGTATAGCSGPIFAGVNSMPQVGNASFGVTCGNASVYTAGFLLLGGAPLPAPLPVGAANVWVDPLGPFLFLLAATANEIGAAEEGLPIPPIPSLEGGTVFAQFLWIDLCAPGALAASDALAITIQG